MSDTLTVADLREALDDVPDDETVWIARGGAVGEATSAKRTADGFLVTGR